MERVKSSTHWHTSQSPAEHITLSETNNMSTKEGKKDDLPKSALELLEEDDEFEV